MTDRQKILVVEDDIKTAQALRLYLEDAGFEARLVHDGRSAVDEALGNPYDLMILDLMLPGLDGTTVCRTVRAASNLPIVMLTARSTTEDCIIGLELGADDYVTKPFSPREMVARVRTILRRAGPSPPAEIAMGGLEIDLDSRRARVHGRSVDLTRIEFDILRCLIQAHPRVLSRDDLIARALGNGFDGFDRTVDAHVMKLRKKIEPDRRNPTFIRTVFGVGYRFAAGTDDE